MADQPLDDFRNVTSEKGPRSSMSNLTAPPCAQTAPTDAEIAAVDNGLDAVLVQAAFEDPDPDPLVAAMQADRDRLAVRGDFSAAYATHHALEDLRHAAAHQRQFDDVEAEA